MARVHIPSIADLKGERRLAHGTPKVSRRNSITGNDHSD